jgi:hypothetical protein
LCQQAVRHGTGVADGSGEGGQQRQCDGLMGHADGLGLVGGVLQGLTHVSGRLETLVHRRRRDPRQTFGDAVQRTVHVRCGIQHLAA